MWSMRTRGWIGTVGIVMSILVGVVERAHACQECGDGVIDKNEECDPGGPLYCNGDPGAGACTTGADCAPGINCYFAASCCKFNCEFVGQGADCSDGSACTTDDRCNNVGECVGQPAWDCPGPVGECVSASCDPSGAPGNCDLLTAIADGGGCNDGDPCSVGETCQAGVCGNGAPKDCSHLGDQCNTAACDPNGQEGNCRLTAVADGTGCDDGDACNVGETCQAGVCVGGAPPNCSDAGGGCDVASCDPGGAEGNCAALVPTNEGGGCDDDNACTTGETCAAGLCVGGVEEDCSAWNDACGVGACEPSTGECGHTPTAEGPDCGSCGDGIDNDSDGRTDLEDTGCSTLALFQRFALLATMDDRPDLHLGWTDQVVSKAGSDVNSLACPRCTRASCMSPAVKPYPTGRSCAAVCANGFVKVMAGPGLEGDLVVNSDLLHPSPLFVGGAWIGGKLVTAGSAPVFKREELPVGVGQPVLCTDGVTPCCTDADCGSDLCEVAEALNPADLAAHQCLDTTGSAPELTECQGAIAATDPNGPVNRFLEGLPVDQEVPAGDLTKGCLKLLRGEEYQIDVQLGAQVVVGIPCLKIGMESRLRLVGQPDQVVVVKVPGMFRTGYRAVIEVVGLQAENMLWALVGKGRGGIEFNSSAKGTFWAPKRRMKLGRGAVLEGAIVAERINTRLSSIVTHAPFTALMR